MPHLETKPAVAPISAPCRRPLLLFRPPLWFQERVEAKEQLIKGSVIAANQTVFPYPIDSFPPLANSEVSSFVATRVCVYVRL